MTFYFAMINAWSLAWEALYGDMDKEYPIIDTSVGAGNTAFEDDGLDYEIDLINGASADYMAEIDDQYSHHFTSEEIYDAVWGDGIEITEEKPMAHYFKYHEEEILKDIQDGTFAKNFVEECDKNKPLMTKLREENSKHEIEKVGKGLRSMFSWLK